ncbi:HAD-IA family hydrolase [Mesobacterium sp. TK19101]|uniref:HAD-IA family hydrolase n=1 Tax=Mesobacterium hydrothermale TaxID=3111907 RepID=A0ABU6HG54_9RHOB|nr:HAD-IA family hydrolase [Mesobacterium sp. TK19101]MEC3861433.1 HAD-IA family hydrolase [Mesobacterium sp. TK19101]
MSLKLVIFDVDGTLVDSQADILGAMTRSFETVACPVPSRDAILGIVGLSLPQAMARLAPDSDQDTRDALVAGYKEAYFDIRRQGGADSSPLYPGIRDVLEHLHAQDEILLGVATGKSRRGLEALLDARDLRRYFITTQVADDHPSKPHPSMLLTALSETGVAAGDAVMIGDTSYDIDMGHAAGMVAIGVTWGYHPASQLRHAHALVDTTDTMMQAIAQIQGGRA